MKLGIAAVERQAVMTYLTTRWKRSQLELMPSVPPVFNPGHEVDEICPIVFYMQPFDPSKPEDLAAVSAYAAREIAGYGQYLVTATSGPFVGDVMALNILGSTWSLETLAGAEQVYPQQDVVDGATVTFLRGDETTFTGTVEATWLHGVGYVVVNLSELRTERLDRGSRGTDQAHVRMILMFATPTSSGISIAESYAGALASLFCGVHIKADPAAAEGTVERNMADSGIFRIFQRPGLDPVQQRPNQLGARDGWNWSMQTIIIRRLYRVAPIGVQPAEAA